MGYLILAVLFSGGSYAFGRAYTDRVGNKKGATDLYLFVELLGIFALWGVWYALDFSFDVAVLPYSFAFAFFFTMGMIGNISAIRTGSLALTSLVISSSLIAVAVWGILFWDASLTWGAGIGFALVFISLCLCLMGGNKKERSGKITGKWLFFVALCFVGNAGCTIAQKSQQIAFSGEHGTMLMVFATLMASLFGVYKLVRGDRSEIKVVLGNKNWSFPLAVSIANVVMNAMVILLASTDLSTNLIYPTISIGGLALSLLISRVVFKERLTWLQWLGMGLGAVATVLLG